MVSSGWVGGISSWFKNAVDKKGTIIHTSLYIHTSTHMKQSVSMCGEVQSSVTTTLQPRAHCVVEYWSKETAHVGTIASQGDWGRTLHSLLGLISVSPNKLKFCCYFYEALLSPKNVYWLLFLAGIQQTWVSTSYPGGCCTWATNAEYKGGDSTFSGLAQSCP